MNMFRGCSIMEYLPISCAFTCKINTLLDFSLPRAFVTSSGKQLPVRQTVSKARLPKTSEGKFNLTRCFSNAKHCE